MTHPWMIYGANGYTGRIIVKVALERGMTPILAGRNGPEIKELAEDHGLQYSAFDLGDSDAVTRELKDVDILLNCAGPFSATAETLMISCLVSSTHYLDITGEIDVFEHAHSLDEAAKEANILLCPGVGFDVIPTDCLAAHLKEALPTARTLSLAFQPVGSKVSPGTAKTTVEGAILLNRHSGHTGLPSHVGAGYQTVEKKRKVCKDPRLFRCAAVPQATDR